MINRGLQRSIVNSSCVDYLKTKKMIFFISLMCGSELISVADQGLTNLLTLLFQVKNFIKGEF